MTEPISTGIDSFLLDSARRFGESPSAQRCNWSSTRSIRFSSRDWQSQPENNRTDAGKSAHGLETSVTDHGVRRSTTG
jgi:hypothetical protein